MQQNKFIKNISEVGDYSADSNILLNTFENIIGHLRLTQVNNWLNKAKTKKLLVSSCILVMEQN